MEREKDVKLYDVDGKEYLDLFSGVGVNVLGYNHPKKSTNDNGASCEIVAFTVSFLNPVAIEYAKKLVECTLKAEKSFYKLWYGSDRNDIKIN